MKKWITTGVVCLLMGLNVMMARAEMVEQREDQAETVEQQVIFESVEQQAGVPEELLIEYEGMKKYWPVISVRELGERWSSDFEFPVLFYVYDAEYYELGERKISRNEDTPGMEGYEGALLEELRLEPEDYVIEAVVWDGEVYQNEEGIQCRNAVARGRKRVKDYAVIYGGTVSGPEKTGTEAEAAETKARKKMADAPGLVVHGAGENVPENGTSWWKVLRENMVLTVTFVAVLLLILCIFLWWKLVHRHRKSEQKKIRTDMFDY